MIDSPSHSDNPEFHIRAERIRLLREFLADRFGLSQADDILEVVTRFDTLWDPIDGPGRDILRDEVRRILARREVQTPS